MLPRAIQELPSPFSMVELEWAASEVESLLYEWQAVNRLFLAGDHWQDGAMWSGPQPPTSEAKYHEIMGEISRAFVSKNAIGEGTDRHVDGVLGNEPAWHYTPTRVIRDDQIPTDDEQALIDQAEAAMTTWWDQRGIHDILQKLTATVLSEGRAPVRLFIPEGLLIGGKLPVVATLEEALSLIYVHTPLTSEMAVIMDLPTRKEAGIYLYSTDDDEARVELVYLQGDQTIIRILKEEQTDDDLGIVEELQLNLGKRLTHYQLERPTIVTEQVRQQQQLLNVALTMLGRNVVQGGFLERIITNAQIPGEYVDDPTAPGGQRFVPASMKGGPGTTQVLQGLPIKSPEGVTTGRTTPGVIYRDPVDVTTFVKTKNEAYLGILEEFHQSHVIMNQDAGASGKSRREARREFLQDLKRTKTVVDKLGRWIVETPLQLAALLINQPDMFMDLRSVFDALLDPGALNPEDEKSIIDVYGAGLRSRYTSMIKLGTDDPDAEEILIKQEREAGLTPVDDESGTGGEGF